MEYIVKGNRNGNRFKAPVTADNEDEAAESFMDDVNEDEFEITEVTTRVPMV